MTAILARVLPELRFQVAGRKAAHRCEFIGKLTIFA
jgi:hypothetical protein